MKIQREAKENLVKVQGELFKIYQFAFTHVLRSVFNLDRWNLWVCV
jgi:hypothetical protein